MIEISYKLKCDQCGYMTTQFISKATLVLAARGVGWLVLDNVCLCPFDTENLSRNKLDMPLDTSLDKHLDAIRNIEQ